MLTYRRFRRGGVAMAQSLHDGLVLARTAGRSPEPSKVVANAKIPKLQPDVATWGIRLASAPLRWAVSSNILRSAFCTHCGAVEFGSKA